MTERTPRSFRATSLNTIDRDRLNRRLAQRFEHRLTLLVAPAGYGKSTALRAALDANRLAPLGTDVWVDTAAEGYSANGALAALAAAFEVAGSNDLDEAVALAAEAVWAKAPDRVAIIIDDANAIDGADEIITALLEQLPANGSLVIGSRMPPTLTIAGSAPTATASTSAGSSCGAFGCGASRAGRCVAWPNSLRHRASRSALRTTPSGHSHSTSTTSERCAVWRQPSMPAVTEQRRAGASRPRSHS